MAEVVEINIICKEELNPYILREFVYRETENCCVYVSTKAMDNWEYDNQIEIDFEVCREYLHSNKIIMVSFKGNAGVAGIDIERLRDCISYTIWFNLDKYDDVMEYNNLINRVLLFLNQSIDNEFQLCAIGKEVLFEYQGDQESLFRESHGIDVWIVLEIELTDTVLQEYEEVNVDNHMVLKKRDTRRGERFW